jgi:hypothetical protein
MRAFTGRHRGILIAMITFMAALFAQETRGKSLVD